MVFYYTLASNPLIMCYMGKDKYENEDLIAYGWPEDVWFHVDKHSSAHVYVRLPRGQTIDDLDEAVIEECCQLTKGNSIEGCKLSSVRIVFTPWSNLKKTATMEAGQVSFHNNKLVQHRTINKNTKILNPLEKTKTWKEVDLKAERDQRDAEERHEEKMKMLEERERQKQEEETRKKASDIKNYVGFMDSANMTSNQDGVDLDDFM